MAAVSDCADLADVLLLFVGELDEVHVAIRADTERMPTTSAVAAWLSLGVRDESSVSFFAKDSHDALGLCVENCTVVTVEVFGAGSTEDCDLLLAYGTDTWQFSSKTFDSIYNHGPVRRRCDFESLDGAYELATVVLPTNYIQEVSKHDGYMASSGVI